MLLALPPSLTARGRDAAASRDEGRSEAGHAAAAASFLKRAALRGRDPLRQARARARRALRAGDGGDGQGLLLPEASTSWRRASSTSPSRSIRTTPSAYNLLGFIALTRDPRSHLGDGGVQEGDRARAATTATAWNNLAAQYLYAKNYDGALDAAEKAASARCRSFAMAQVNLGSAYRGKQQYAEAETRATSGASSSIPNYADAYFNLGILYLDAKQMPGTDLITKLNTSINYLNKYKQLAGYRLHAERSGRHASFDEARTGIEREQKRIERQQRNAARNAQKAAQPAGAIKTGGDK